MCNCRNKSKSNTTNRSSNCPNKRLQLNNLKSDAISKSNLISDEVKKNTLLNLASDIENYLSNDSVCPKSEYILSIKETIKNLTN